jgi:fibronectin-binding autotransporter adhesin
MSSAPLPRPPSRCLAVVLAAALVLASTSQAQTPTYSWDSLSGNWVGGTPAANGSASTILQFTMDSNPYLTNPNATALPQAGLVSTSNPNFTLNGLILNLQSTASGGVSAQTSPSSAIPFNWNLVANGSSLPFINITGSVSNNLGVNFGSAGGSQTFTLSANTTIGGNGSGMLAFTGNCNIVGSGSLTFARTGTGPFAVTSVAEPINGTQTTYSGGTIIQSGVVIAASSSSESAFGTGNLKLNGGTLAATSQFATYTSASVSIGGNVTFGYIIPGGQFTTTSPFSGIAVSPITLGNSTSGPISLTGTTSPTLTSVGGQTTTLTAAVGSVNSGVGLIVDGWGALVLNAADTYSGNTQLNLGTLQVPNSAGPPSTSALIFNGGWLQVTNTGSTVTLANPIIVQNNLNMTGSYGITSTSTTAIDLGQSGGAPVFNILPTISATTIDAALVNNESSTGGLFKTGAGTLILAASNSYTGMTTISPLPPSNAPFGLPLVNAAGAYPTGGAGGQITLNQAGALAAGNAGVIIVGPGANSTGTTTGGTLLLDNTAQSVNNRLGGPTVPVNLQGGTLQVIGNAATTVTESFGPLTLSGSSTISLSFASASTSEVLELTAASLLRSNFGVLNLVGTTVGTSVAGTFGVASLQLTNSATATNALIGGGGALGTPNVSIIPWAAGENSTYALNEVNTFVTYTSSYGFHPLTSSEYTTVSTSLTSGSSTTNNIVYKGASTSTLNSATTVNSLNLQVNVTITGAGSLIITSGAILQDSLIASTISSPLVAGATTAPIELVILGATSLVLSGGVTAAGLTVATSGGVTLGAANPNLTGNITLNSGTLSVSAANQFGAASNVIFQGGTLKFTQAAGDVSVSANYTVASAGGNITLPNLGTTQTLTGNLLGSGALNLTGVSGSNLAAPNAFNFAGDNSGFTGAVVLSAGALNLNSANSGGNNSGNTSSGYALTLASGSVLGANGSVPVSVPGTVTLLGSTTATSLLIGGAQNLSLATGTNAALVLPTPAGTTMTATIIVLNAAVTATIAGTVSTSPAGTSNTTVNGFQTTGLTSLTVQGPGTLVFSQPLVLNGNLGNLGGGTLQLNGLTLGGGVANGATALTGTPSAPSYSTGTIIFNGTTTLMAGQLVNNFGVVTFNGPASINGVAAATSTPGSLINNYGQANFLGTSVAFGGDITLNGGQLTFGSSTAVSGIGNIGLAAGASALFTSGGPTLATTIIGGATMTVAGAASLGTLGATAANSAVIVGPGSALVLDNTALNSNTRLANAAGTTPNTLTLAGQFTILGNASAPTLEAIGSLTQGSNYLGMGAITLVPAGTNETRVIINSLSLPFGGALFIQGQNLGNATALAAGSGAPSSRVIFNTTPTLASTTVPILPVAYGFDSNPSNPQPYGFLTYDSTVVNGAVVGLRPLMASEYATSFTVGASTTNNINLTSTVTGVNSATTVGSLLIGGGGGLSGSAALTVSSGAVLAANGNNSGVTLSALTLDGLTYQEGVITTVSNLTINGALTTTANASGGLIKDGPGALTLNGALTLTATTTIFYITQGAVILGQSSAIGSSNRVELAPGGFLNLNGTTQSIGALLSPGTLSSSVTLTGGGGVLLPTGSALTIGNNNDASTFDGFLVGPGSLTKVGTGGVVLTRFSPLTGAVNVTGGSLTILGTGALANAGAITLNGGTLGFGSAVVSPGIGSSQPPAPSGATQVYVSYQNVVLGSAGGGLAPVVNYTSAGIISGTGGLSSSGLLYLPNATNTYSGSTTITSSTLSIGSSVLDNQNSPLGNSSAAIILAPNGSSNAAFSWGTSASNQNILIDRPIQLGGTSTGTRTIDFYGNAVLTANSTGIDLAGKTLTFGYLGNTTTIMAPIISSTGAGQIAFPNLALVGNVNFWAASTYSGGTTIATGNVLSPVMIGLGVDTAGSPGSITSGPLGTGTLSISVGGVAFHADNPSAPYLQLTAARQFANPISLSAAGDIYLYGVSNLNLPGTVSESGSAAMAFGVGASNIQQNLTLSGVITTSGAMTKTGAGVLTLANSGSLISGAWALDGGSLAFSSDSALGDQTGSNLTISVGGASALNLTGNIVSSRPITLSNSNLTFDAAPGTSSSFSGAITGSGTVTKNDTGALTISSSSGSLTGAVAVNNGLLNWTSRTGTTGYSAGGPGSALNVTGTISDTTATLTADVGGTLTLNNSANSTYVNFGGGAVTLGGGALALIGSSGSSNSQSVGAMSLTANTTSTITLTPTSGASGALVLASSKLTVGANAALLVAGANLGGTGGASSQVTFSTAPTLVGAGASNTPSRGIVAGVIGDVTPTGNGSGFVTYGGSNGAGLVPLSSSEYISTITAGDNVQLTASNSISSGTAVNSLNLQNVASAATLSVGSVALTLTSGMLLVNNAASGNSGWTISGTGASSALASGSATPVLWVVTNLTLSVPLTTTATGVEKGGPGTLVLNNTTGSTTALFAPTASGTIFRIDGGAVQVGQTANVFNTNVVVQVGPGATFDLYGNSQTIGGLTTPTASLVSSFTGTLATQPIGSVTLEAAPASSPPTLTVAGSTSDTFAGTISGAGGFTRAGAGATTFYSPQSYTGTTTILSGTLAFGVAATTPLLASSSIVLGDLNNPTGSATLTLAATASGAGVAYTFGSSSQTLTVSPVDTAFTGTRTFNANTGGSGTYVNLATELTTPVVQVALNISLAGTAANPSRLTLSGAAIYTGTISDTSPGGDLPGSIALSGTSRWYLTGANSYTGGTIVLSGASATIGLGASGSLGTGQVNVGVTQSGSAGFGSSTSLTLLSILPSGSSLSVSNPINFSGSTAQIADLTVTGLSDLNLTGAINLNTNSSTAESRTLNITNFGTTTLSGGLTSTGPVPTLTKNGTGLLVLPVDSPTLTTAWQIASGVLQILTNNGLGATGNSVTVTTTSNSTGELQLIGAAAPGGGLTIGTSSVSEPLTIGGLGYTVEGALHSVSGTNAWNGTVTLIDNYSNMNTAIGVDSGSSLIINGNVVNGANLPPVNLTKFGAGQLTINGNLTNTGQTFVNGGQLIVNGTIGGADLMTIQQTAGLGGSAIVNRAVAFETGTSISPGTPGTTPGTLIFNNSVTFLGGFTYNWRVSGNTSDLVVVNNAALTFSPLDVVDVKIIDLPGTGPTQNVYTLFDPASSITGFNGANWIVDTSGLSNANAALWSAYTVNQVGNTIVLTNTAAPEPTAPLLAIAMAAGVVLLLRRRAYQAKGTQTLRM